MLLEELFKLSGLMHCQVIDIASVNTQVINYLSIRLTSKDDAASPNKFQVDV